MVKTLKMFCFFQTFWYFVLFLCITMMTKHRDTCFTKTTLSTMKKENRNGNQKQEHLPFSILFIYDYFVITADTIEPNILRQ